MPATITLNLDDNTAAGFASMVQSAGTAEDQVKQLVHQLRAMEKATADAAKASSGWGNAAQKVTAVSAAFLGSITLLRQMTFAARKAGQVINELAERGNQGAIQLQESFRGLQDTLVSMANDPGIQDLLNKMSQGVQGVAKGVASVPTSSGGLKELAAGAAEQLRGVGGFGFTAGLLESYAGDLKAVQAEEIKIKGELQLQAKEREKQAVIAKQQKQADADIFAVNQQIFAGMRRTALEQETDAKKLIDLREAELAKLKELAASGKLTDDERKRSLQEIMLLEERRLKLIEEQKQAAKKAADEQEAAQKKFVASILQNAASAVKSYASMLSQIKEQEKAGIAAMVAEYEKMVGKLAEQIQGLKGGATGDQNIVQGIKGGLSDQATLKQIADNRAKAAGGSAANQRRARNTALEQFRQGGQFDPAEVAKAQEELTQQVINQAVASGQLNQKQADGLRQAAGVLQQQAEIQAQQEQDIKAIMSALESANRVTSGTGRRQRAQRNSGN